MKILLFVNSSWNVINFRANLVKALLQQGHHVVVMAPRDQYTPLLFNINCQYVELNFSSRSINPFSELRLFRRVITEMREICPDAVISFTLKPNIYGALAARILGKAYFPNIAGLGISHSNFLLRRIVRLLCKVALSRSEICFFQNIDDQEYFLTNGIVPKHAARLLPGSGVDTRRFFVDTDVHTKRYDSNRFRFLLSGRLLRSKGIFEYELAAKRLSQEFDGVDFIVMGFSSADSSDTVSEEDLKRWREEGVITFDGSSDDMKSVLEDVHCFVLPTYYGEGTPKSLLEAAAMELPIITTDSAGCRDVVQDGLTGFLCQKADHEDLYQKMKMMLELTAANRQAMGKRARTNIVKHFDDRLVSQAYLSCLTSGH